MTAPTDDTDETDGVGGVIRELSRRGFCEICGRGSPARASDRTTHRYQGPKMTQMKQMVWVGSSGNSLGVVSVESVGAVPQRGHQIAQPTDNSAHR